MSINLKAFMKPELKDRGTMEFEGIEAFKDEEGKPIPFIIKRLSQKEVKDIRKLYRTTEVYRDKRNGNHPVITGDGQVAVMKDYDAESAGLHMMVDAFVQPKMDDPELMKFYGVYDRLEMPQILFANAADFNYANRCLMEACGTLAPKKSEKKIVDDLKN